MRKGEPHRSRGAAVLLHAVRRRKRRRTLEGKWVRDLRAGIYRACGLLNRRTSLPVSPKTFFDSDKFDTDPWPGGAVTVAVVVIYIYIYIREKHSFRVRTCRVGASALQLIIFPPFSPPTNDWRLNGHPKKNLPGNPFKNVAVGCCWFLCISVRVWCAPRIQSDDDGSN